MKNVGMIGPNDATFVKRDVDILAKHYETRAVYGMPDPRSPLEMTAKVAEIVQAVRWADALVLWFADWHTFIASRTASVLNKPTVTVVGGYDVASIDEIDYGALNTKLGHRRNNHIFQNSAYILPVSTGLKRDLLTHFELDEQKVQVVPTGYDSEWFSPRPGTERSGVLTVALADDKMAVRLKGLDHYADIAGQFPETEFVVVGVSGDARQLLETDRPRNLRLVGPVDQETLLRYYQEANVYCQLSMREGLCNALAEAMLCGCIPVGYDVQGVTDLISEVGHLVPARDPETASKTVRTALAENNEQRNSVREFVKQHFSIEKRDRSFELILESL